jgi:hypothetical protein
MCNTIDRLKEDISYDKQSTTRFTRMIEHIFWFSLLFLLFLKQAGELCPKCEDVFVYFLNPTDRRYRYSGGDTIPDEIGVEVYASDVQNVYDELLSILPFHLHLPLPAPEGPVLPVRWRRPASFLAISEWRYLVKGMSRKRWRRHPVSSQVKQKGRNVEKWMWRRRSRPAASLLVDAKGNHLVKRKWRRWYPSCPLSIQDGCSANQVEWPWCL